MFRHFFNQIHFFSVSFGSVLIFLLKILYCIYIVVLISEECSEPCQISKIEFFAKTVNSLKPLFWQKAPSQMFDRVLNTPLDGWILQSGFSEKLVMLNLQIGYCNGDQFFFSKLFFLKIVFIKIFFRFTFSKGLINRMV